MLKIKQNPKEIDYFSDTIFKNKKDIIEMIRLKS